ncbi:MAG: hypothetical protein DCC67_15720 [Planctomycetota bacterium]|nr:MAG: hypothetical protein DCC67_15720 [Planctomycetota bacterium]
MGRITSSVGLISGLQIEETVTQLMAVAARPRDLLKARTDALKQEQAALDTLGSRLLAFQFAVNKLKAATVYTAREATSSNKDVLQVSLPASGAPPVGTFQVRPVQLASAQQLVSQGFDSSTTGLGSGAFSFRFGGFMDRGVSLDELNGGAGVPRGKIRITDRNGDSAVIDLTYARTVDDVIRAVNESLDVAVTASTNGDALVLTDSSGGSGNLSVNEVGGGTTAAGLGLAGVSVAATTATGSDILRLHGGTKLASLNDGLGVHTTKTGVADLDVTFSDGSTLAIDLHAVTTLGDVVAQINAASPAKLAAAISADGRRLELSDLTGGAGDFTVENGVASRAATDLGIETTSSAATIVGDRLIAGLKDTLLASLNGGEGLGALGQISITDRDGGPVVVDLAPADTLGDVINLINASGAEVVAAVNSARNGLVIADASGGSGNLVVASADAADAAAKLGIVIDQAAGSVNSGALRRQTIGQATLLASLNGGKGVAIGDLEIIDTAGVRKTVDLNSMNNPARTVGDVIDGINASVPGVEARINDSGDGIILVDAAGGTGNISVKDMSGNIAQSLNLTRASKTIDVNGAPTQVIDGTTSFTVDLDDLDVSSDAIALSSLKGGAGIPRGDILITDSTGERSLALDLNGADAGIATIGQFIDAINEKAAAGRPRQAHGQRPQRHGRRRSENRRRGQARGRKTGNQRRRRLLLDRRRTDRPGRAGRAHQRPQRRRHRQHRLRRPTAPPVARREPFRRRQRTTHRLRRLRPGVRRSRQGPGRRPALRQPERRRRRARQFFDQHVRGRRRRSESHPGRYQRHADHGHRPANRRRAGEDRRGSRRRLQRPPHRPGQTHRLRRRDGHDRPAVRHERGPAGRHAACAIVDRPLFRSRQLRVAGPDRPHRRGGRHARAQ